MLHQFEIDALKKVDEYIVLMGLVAPAETVPQLPQLRGGYKEKVITSISASSYKPRKNLQETMWPGALSCRRRQRN